MHALSNNIKRKSYKIGRCRKEMHSQSRKPLEKEKRSALGNASIEQWDQEACYTKYMFYKCKPELRNYMEYRCEDNMETPDLLYRW